MGTSTLTAPTTETQLSPSSTARRTTRFRLPSSSTPRLSSTFGTPSPTRRSSLPEHLQEPGYRYNIVTSGIYEFRRICRKGRRRLLLQLSPFSGPSPVAEPLLWRFCTPHWKMSSSSTTAEDVPHPEYWALHLGGRAGPHREDSALSPTTSGGAPAPAGNKIVFTQMESSVHVPRPRTTKLTLSVRVTSSTYAEVRTLRVIEPQGTRLHAGGLISILAASRMLPCVRQSSVSTKSVKHSQDSVPGSAPRGSYPLFDDSYALSRPTTRILPDPE